jgi:hypothetical protein
MKQFRDAYGLANKPVGASSVFARRQDASFEKAERAMAAAIQ